MLKRTNYPCNACCQQKGKTYSRKLEASIPMFAQIFLHIVYNNVYVFSRNTAEYETFTFESVLPSGDNIEGRGVLRTLSSIYGGTFLQQ